MIKNVFYFISKALFVLKIESNGVRFTHHNFKGKSYAIVFFISCGFPYQINGFVKPSTQESFFIANFHFPDITGSLIVALNSSCSQKLAILDFTFTVNTFLPLMENGGNLTDSDVFTMLNVGGLHNPD